MSRKVAGSPLLFHSKMGPVSALLWHSCWDIRGSLSVIHASWLSDQGNGQEKVVDMLRVHTVWLCGSPGVGHSCRTLMLTVRALHASAWVSHYCQLNLRSQLKIPSSGSWPTWADRAPSQLCTCWDSGHQS